MAFARFATLVCSLPLLFPSPVYADVDPFRASQAALNGDFGNYTRQSHLSDPGVVGPVANVLVSPQPGVSPSKHVGWAPLAAHLPISRPMLIDAHTFSTVWSGPALGDQTWAPTVQSCNGSSYLTWWAGTVITQSGYAAGSHLMINEKYELAYNITAAHPLEGADLHELYITPECTALVTAYKVHQHNITSSNVTRHWLMDSYFQEIDLATGKLLFHWQATQAIPDMDSEAVHPFVGDEGQSQDKPFDWFHLNSVDKDHLGNYLISARRTCTVYYISGADGAVLWRLGGANNDFKDMSGGKATDFCSQHHARWVDSSLTRLSIYDDRNELPIFYSKDPISRGIIVELDHSKKEARLEHSYQATGSIVSDRKGSMQVLMDSPIPENVMLGYGNEPAWSEFAADGTVLLDVTFGPLHRDRSSADNYRSLKVNWTGLPYWGPKIAPGPSPDFDFDATKETFSVRLADESGTRLMNDTVYFSWNGATEIQTWVILASNDTLNLTMSEHYFVEVDKIGFEDYAWIGAHAKYVAAVAVNGDDQVLGATDVLDVAAFRLSIGPAGIHGNDTAALTRAWQTHLAAQRGDTDCNAFLVAFLLSLSFVPAILYWRAQHRRGRLLCLVLATPVRIMSRRMPRRLRRLSWGGFNFFVESYAATSKKTPRWAKWADIYEAEKEREHAERYWDDPTSPG